LIISLVITIKKRLIVNQILSLVINPSFLIKPNLSIKPNLVIKPSLVIKPNLVIELSSIIRRSLVIKASLVVWLDLIRKQLFLCAQRFFFFFGDRFTPILLRVGIFGQLHLNMYGNKRRASASHCIEKIFRLIIT
jgi:hypothetical protein